MRISAVRVEGATNTRSSFFGFLINPVLASSTSKDSPSNLESVLHSTRKLSHILHKTDIFKSVDATIERARSALADTDDVDIVFKTREKGRYYLNTSTELGNNEGSAVRYFMYISPSVQFELHIIRLQLVVSGMYLAALKFSRPISPSGRRLENHFARP